MFDLHNQLDSAYMLKPQTFAAATSASTAIDLQGFNGAEVVAILGTIAEATMASTNLSLRLQEADTNSAASFTAVAEADLLGAVSGTTTGEFANVDAFAEDDTTYQVGYKGAKRYVRTYHVWTGSIGTGCPLAVIGLKGEPIHAPVS